MPQKNILLFGAGKSATILIEYLKTVAQQNNWLLTVADTNYNLVITKTDNAPNTKAIEASAGNDAIRKELIAHSDVVISMLPPALHYLIAVDCVHLNKHLLTASYVDENIKALQQQILSKDLLFLCEMGLDPGIDHMTAMQMIDNIHAKGGEIVAFKSHCGGLIAPESDDNSWHYKISWNPANIVAAGKSGADYKDNGKLIHLNYEEVFANRNTVEVPGYGKYGWYANRDSLAYVDLYHLHNTSSFIRTTLRHPDFLPGWKSIIDLNLTSTEDVYETDEMSIAEFFNQHFAQRQNGDFFNELKKDEILNRQFLHLGLNDNSKFINKGKCNAAQILQFILEKKLALQPGDKDMIIMMHEIDYELEGRMHHHKAWLVLKGEDDVKTAMAKTVGLPLGITATLLLENKISLRGLHIPVNAAIYTPVLKELANQGICFEELHHQFSEVFP